jgi:pyruvate-formate lyase
MGLKLGEFESFKTFEEFQEAFKRNLLYQIKLLAQAQASIYKTTSEEAFFPFLSMLYDDCIENGKPLLSGGVTFKGGTLESFGNNSAADALYAIKKAVYVDKILTHKELLDCIDKDFAGYEGIRCKLKAYSKYGNDDSGADEMSLWLNTIICQAAQSEAANTDIYSFNVVLVNNGDSVLFGKATAASVDGRKAGEPVSNGNQPSAGNDKSGLTALLNSMSKLNPSLHAGATHNLKISKKEFERNISLFKALIKGYFKNGGTQLMITIADLEDLLAALLNPEENSNLIVRVGGYSERFIELPKEIQLEIINRTTY